MLWMLNYNLIIALLLLFPLFKIKKNKEDRVEKKGGIKNGREKRFWRFEERSDRKG